MRVRPLLLAILASGCGAEARELAPQRPDIAAAHTTAAAEKSELWADATRSPWPAGAARDGDEREALLAAACGTRDASLERVSRELAASRARGLGAPDPDLVVSKMRAAGEPHVRPRLLTAAGHAPLDDEAIRAKLARLRGAALTRCGVATARTDDGGEVLVALAVDALADLAPLPLRARTGEWLTFEAELQVPARAATLVILGPRGAPRTVPTSLDARGRARARFALDRPGAFQVQLVADVEGGPRPVLEARVFADVEPPNEADVEAAPGEDAGHGPDDAASLASMIAALRASEVLSPLVRDERMDTLAAAHARRMRDEHVIGHDVGDGDPQGRFASAGLDATTMGENVAHAASIALAHRVLHASPSHRMNLLRANYTHIGLGVAPAEDGSVYVCELFAARPR